MDSDRVGGEYLDHLTDADLRLLASVSGTRVEAAALRREPGRVVELFEHPYVFEAVFGRDAVRSGLIGVSPFLAFAVVVLCAAAALASMTYLPERSGPRQRIPVFDAHQLRDFLDSAQRRLFLAELLPRASSPPGWRNEAGDWRQPAYSLHRRQSRRSPRRLPRSSRVAVRRLVKRNSSERLGCEARVDEPNRARGKHATISCFVGWS